MNDNVSRGEAMLDFIEDEAMQRINPDDEECWHCSGEGYTYDCIDGCCLDADSGCEDCARPCAECRLRRIEVKRAVRTEVLRSLDLDLATAWLKKQGKWSPKLTRGELLLNLHAGIVASKEFSDEQRMTSACWVEGLI